MQLNVVENKLNITSELSCNSCIHFDIFIFISILNFRFENLVSVHAQLTVAEDREENVPKIFFIRHSPNSFNWLVASVCDAP